MVVFYYKSNQIQKAWDMLQVLPTRPSRGLASFLNQENEKEKEFRRVKRKLEKRFQL